MVKEFAKSHTNTLEWQQNVSDGHSWV